MVMRAEVVLNDCRRALLFAENDRSEQEFRVHWVALITLLRTVGHVLDKVDAVLDPKLRKAVDERWHAWQFNREEHRIFWEFIENERNSVLKTYKLGVQSGDIQVMAWQDQHIGEFALDEGVFKPLLNGPFAGEDGRDVAEEAILWWENQLSEIRRAEAQL